MIDRGMLLSLLVIAVILGGMVGYVLLKKQEQVQDQPAKVDSVLIHYDSVQISKTFTDGTHEISGIITTPTPCYTVETELLIAESYPEQVTLDVTVKGTEDMCVQVQTDKLFDVSYQAAEEASLRVQINDKPVTIKYIE